jgi:hypothetical protein
MPTQNLQRTLFAQALDIVLLEKLFAVIELALMILIEL